MSDSKIDEKKLIEIGVYYLYFICVYLEKLLNKMKSSNITTHRNIEFKDLIDKEFIELCNKIKINDFDYVNSEISTKKIKINFSKKFIYEINNNISIGESVYDDLKYLAFFFYNGSIGKKSNSTIESIIDYFYKMKQEAFNKFQQKDKTEEISVNPNTGYIVFAKDDKKPIDGVDSIFNDYMEAKAQANEIIVNLNNTIGCRLKKFLIEDMQEIYLSPKTYLNMKMVVEQADFLLNVFFGDLQKDYLIDYANLLINESEKKFELINNDEKLIFIEELELLLKDE